MSFRQEFIAVISRKKAGVLRHMGILLPDGRVAHCSPEIGEHISSVEEFAAGQDVTVERIVSASEHMATLNRIQGALRSPKQYDAVTNNCEIFANRMTGENPVSVQLHGVALLAGLVVLISLAAANA